MDFKGAGKMRIDHTRQPTNVKNIVRCMLCHRQFLTEEKNIMVVCRCCDSPDALYRKVTFTQKDIAKSRIALAELSGKGLS